MRHTQPNKVFDSGLQQGRTALAWDRTGLSMMVAGAVLLRSPSSTFMFLPIIVGGVVVVTGAWLTLVAHLRYSKLHRVLRAEQSILNPRLIRWVGFTTMALALASILDVLAM